jgi:hypothetical protein
MQVRQRASVDVNTDASEAPTTGQAGALLNSAHAAVDQRALLQPLVMHLQDVVRDGGANGLCRCILYDSYRGNTEARQTASPLSSTCKLGKHMPNSTQLPSGRMANLQPALDRWVHAGESRRCKHRLQCHRLVQQYKL